MDMELRVVELHAMRLSPREIAKEIGVAHNTVYAAVDRVRVQYAELLKQRWFEVASADIATIDLLIKKFIASAVTGDAKAADVVMKAIIQRAKIFGYEADSRTSRQKSADTAVAQLMLAIQEALTQTLPPEDAAKVYERIKLGYTAGPSHSGVASPEPEGE